MALRAQGSPATIVGPRAALRSLLPLYAGDLPWLFMRESAKTDKTHLPKGTYQEWLKSQKEEPSAKGRGKEVTENSFETWMAKRVKRQVKKTSSRAISKRKPS